MPDDKNPTRVRVLADGETKEWSVLLPQGCWPLGGNPERLFVLVEPSNLILIDTAAVTSAKETAERFVDTTDRCVVLRRDDARWLLDVLPMALDHAGGAALHEDRHPSSVLTLARQLVRELRATKAGTHPWTIGECELLSTLCSVLGVDRHDGGLEK